MIDRFNNGEPKNDKQLEVGNLEGYQGGDIRGIIKRMDYIKKWIYYCYAFAAF